MSTENQSIRPEWLTKSLVSAVCLNMGALTIVYATYLAEGAILGIFFFGIYLIAVGVVTSPIDDNNGY